MEIVSKEGKRSSTSPAEAGMGVQGGGGWGDAGRGWWGRHGDRGDVGWGLEGTGWGWG